MTEITKSTYDAHVSTFDSLSEVFFGVFNQIDVIDVIAIDDSFYVATESKLPTHCHDPGDAIASLNKATLVRCHRFEDDTALRDFLASVASRITL